MNIKKTLQAHADGVTLTPTLEPYAPSTGYAVAYTDNAVLNIEQLDEQALNAELAHLHDIARKVQLSSYYIGYWLDRKTGIGYLDLSVIVDDVDTALYLAKLHNQKAVFNFSNFESVYVS